MKVAHLSRIVIAENRQRQEFDPTAHQDLVNSIDDNGLMHAPVFREEEDQLVLVAGERRLKAIEELASLGKGFRYDGEAFKDGYFPYVTLGELSHLEAEEAELDENLKRRDLTWQEHAAAVERLHNLRLAQADEHLEKVLQDHADEGLDASQIAELAPKHTVADTAEEVTGRRDGGYQDSVRKELIVAQHLNNPVIAKAKSADEAFKLLKREEERKRNIELAETVGAAFNADSHTLLHCNCLDWMANSTNHNQFDVILTDPPYGMGADTFGDAGGSLSGIEHHYDDSYESWQRLMEGEWDSTDGLDTTPGWCKLSYLVAKPQAHAYVFCDIDRFHELKQMMEAAGWYVFRTPMINVKSNSGRVPLPDRGPRRQYEILLYAIKGKKPVTHIYPDVITSLADEQMGHGAQKPVSLYENLLQRSVRPGDRVLDSFAGSGTIFPAAHSMHVYATGLEQSDESYGMCLQRLQTLKSNDSLSLNFEGTK